MASVRHALPNGHVITGEAVKGIKDLTRLRLVTGLILILNSLMGVLGADWDIQWHAVVGRDRTFTPPHDLILLAIALSGIVALTSILIETSWARRQPELQAYSTDFMGLLHASTGSYLIGFGAVCSAVAFPLDTYWHSLYGIDVSLWAPFHTMIYMGSVLSTFGMIYLLLSAAHLSEMQHDLWMTTRLSYAGVVALLGILLSKFSTFLTPALSGHTIHFASLTLSLFPFLMAFIAVFLCVLTVRLVPWTGTATMMVLVFLFVFLLMSTSIPPLMSLLVQAEHETYLARATHIGSTIVPLMGQTPLLLLTALSLDGIVWLGRRGKWLLTKQNVWGLVVAIISMIVVAGFTLVQYSVRQRALQGGIGRFFMLAFALEIALALLLTIPGSLLGNWLALTISKAIQTQRR